MRIGYLAGALALLALSAGLLLHTLFDPGGWSRRQKVETDLERVRDENARTETRVGQLRSDVKALRTRPEVQERAVRDELGFVRPTEVVIELGSPSPAPPE
ncbi:septum formation initiator family protein [Myxococcota bacterium]